MPLEIKVTVLSDLSLAGRVFNGSGKPVDKGPSVLAEDYLDIQGKQMLQAHPVKMASTEGSVKGLTYLPTLPHLNHVVTVPDFYLTTQTI